jgi:hypothetical protein
MIYVRVTSVLTAAVLLTLAANAQAQSMPPQGEVHVTFAATSVPPVAPMPIGEGKQYLQVNMIMSASNDEGNPILNNMGGRCQLTRLIDNGKIVENHGYCTYTDADNDQIFEKCDWSAGQTLPPGATLLCSLTGGTGKFQGLQAPLVISSVPVKSTYEGAFQIVGHKNGTYKIVKTSTTN